MKTGQPIKTTILRAILVAMAAVIGAPAMTSDARADDSIRSGPDDIGSGISGKPHRRMAGGTARCIFAVLATPKDDRIEEAARPHDRTLTHSGRGNTVQHSAEARNSYGAGSYAASALGTHASVLKRSG